MGERFDARWTLAIVWDYALHVVESLELWKILTLPYELMFILHEATIANSVLLPGDIRPSSTLSF